VTHSQLADILDETGSHLIAGVDEIMSPTAAALPLRRTIERLPGLLCDLAARLRGRLGEPELPIQFDVAPLVAAMRLLKQSIYALIDERQVPITPSEVRIVGDWFADLTESALAAETRRVADKLEVRVKLLSKLSALAETMEYDRVLVAVAHMTIPELADWCIMNIVENGRLRRVTVAHRDPAKAALAAKLLNFPPQLQTQPFAEHVMAGNSVHVANLEEPIGRVDPEFAVILREVGARSCLLVPFLVMGKVVALANFLLTPESGRHFDAEDVALAEEISRRAAQILENARLHQQLQQSDARFRRALEDAKVAVVETDLERRLRWLYNTRLDARDGEFIGKTASELVGSEMGAALDDLQRRVFETGEGARATVSATRGDKRHHFLVRYEPLRDTGRIVGFSGSTVDVTELKEAEDQLARELAFRERMMGILGHDLRNPVSAVLALAPLLHREDGMSDKARERLGVIERSARRMNEMIGALLDFTRLRFHGSLPVAIEEIDLHELVRGIVAELRAVHRTRTIELSASGNLRGRWDPGRIAQLLSNLAANALWHGALESPVVVSIAEEGEAVLLSVTNRGPVILPELVDRLFEPFQQGTESSGNGRRGLGLGLFIVREIVRAHGGTIDVRSGDDLTTFAVMLPRTAPLTSVQ
jgi:PAS domain S-box-containing protein